MRFRYQKSGSVSGEFVRFPTQNIFFPTPVEYIGVGETTAQKPGTKNDTNVILTGPPAFELGCIHRVAAKH